MLRKSLKIGGGVLLALAILLPDLSLPAAAFPLPQTQIAPVAGPGLDNGVVLVDIAAATGVTIANAAAHGITAITGTPDSI